MSRPSALSIMAGAFAAMDIVLSLFMGFFAMWATKGGMFLLTFVLIGLSLLIGAGGFGLMAAGRRVFALIWGIGWFFVLLILAILGFLIGTSPMGVV